MNPTKNSITRRFAIQIAIFLLLADAICPPQLTSSANITKEEELKSRIELATAGFKDICFVGTVTQKNKKAMSKIESNYARLYDFQSARVYYKEPNKLRIEGKLGMVKFEYICNGNTKIVRAPAIRLSNRKDYPGDPAKLQDAFDIGLMTPSLWSHRNIEIIDDPEASANGEIKLRLRWPKGEMIHFAWLDGKDLWLKRFEKRTGDGKLLYRVNYSNPRKAGDIIWMPTVIEVFTSDGEKAGTTEYSDIKVNTNLSDTLFE
ncbi:MAG: hypothetical protein ACUVRS_07260 [Armatimonadota bacterium]